MSIKHIDIYTDGACSGNPGPGGWGVFILVFYKNGYILRKKLRGISGKTTNNNMELTAVLNTFRLLNKAKIAPKTVINFYIDSQYVIKGLTEYKDNWKKRNFKNVANALIWRKVIYYYEKHLEEYSIKIEKVKGHSGVAGNEEADRLANFFRYERF